MNEKVKIVQSMNICVLYIVLEISFVTTNNKLRIMLIVFEKHPWGLLHPE